MSEQNDIPPATQTPTLNLGRSWDGASRKELNHLHEYQKYLMEGLRLIKGGQYWKALEKAYETDPAQAVGYKVNRSRGWLSEKPPPIEQVPSLANQLGLFAYHWHKGEKSLDLPYLAIKGQERNNPAAQKLAHELALIVWEEHFHAYQELSGVPLAGYENTELDVAAFYLAAGVPVTSTYLSRHDRGLFLKKDAGLDDTLTQRPALRRGTFVRVRRRVDQRVEKDWQITGFDPQTGDAIVWQIRQGLEKKIPTPNLAELNEEGVYPFSQCNSFEELFTTIDHLGGIHGTQELFLPKRLKHTINQVRQGRIPIESIPRSGGLREEIKRLQIGQVSSWQELFKTIKITDGLYGSDGYYYSQEELENALREVQQKGKDAIKFVTRTGGLREKAKELLAQAQS